MLGVEWSNLGYAGAFIVGTIAGAVVTLRLGRVLVDYFRNEQRRKDDG